MATRREDALRLSGHCVRKKIGDRASHGFLRTRHHLWGWRLPESLAERCKDFHSGRVVIGQCAERGCRFRFSKRPLRSPACWENGGTETLRDHHCCKPNSPDEMFGGVPVSPLLSAALESQKIEFVSDFDIKEITPASFIAASGARTRLQAENGHSAVSRSRGGPGPRYH